VRGALETELPTLEPAVFRSRFHLWEVLPAATMVRTLDRIRVLGRGP
jgi:LacI family transcriptional regulator